MEKGLDINRIFEIKNDDEFAKIALDVFYYQKENCIVYSEFLDLLPIQKQHPKYYTEIPFLPISFYKTHSIVDKNLPTDFYFESSGTTLQTKSKHFISDIEVYKKSFTKCFEQFFGTIENYCIIGLLPNYLERNHSSLVYMVNELMNISNHEDNNFYLYEHETLRNVLEKLSQTNQKTIVFGVSFSLLDFAESNPESYDNVIYIETGGMKGRKKEMTKPELLAELQLSLKSNKIYSEYGMTELLSQAYSFGENVYQCPNWMKILIRETDNPFRMITNQTGGINIIDLANIHSCSFIATDDMGKVNENGHFEFMGRIDQSDVRGCSLLIH